MNNGIFVVPTTHIHHYWHLAELYLEKAIITGNGEFTASQLKQFLAQGNSVLFIVIKNDKPVGAFTVQWVNYPNDRVAYITYIGGETTQDGWQQFLTWVKDNGGTLVQGSTSKQSIVRLWRMKFGLKPKYTLMELRL